MQDYNITPGGLNLLQRVRYSIFPGTLRKLKDRESYRNFFNSLILHFRPRSVQERALRFSLTWGLGGMAVVLVFMIFTTGLMLKFVYQPVPDRAYESIIHLQNNVLFGQLIRNIHHWSGNALLIIVFLHFLRVFLTGAFHPPRQFNWIIGLAMFLAVLTSNITGYLLPWDQLAFWAITIWRPGLSPVVGNGILPTAFVLAAIIVFYWLVKKKYAATNNESIQSVFVLLVIAFIILTITGIWFRGLGMALVWPWEVGS